MSNGVSGAMSIDPDRQTCHIEATGFDPDADVNVQVDYFDENGVQTAGIGGYTTADNQGDVTLDLPTQYWRVTSAKAVVWHDALKLSAST